MKKNKKKLDEMQEKKLSKIEHNALTLTSAGLFISIFIQEAVWSIDSRVVIGECAVLLLSSIYVLIACIRNGIWDRSANQPNMRQNALISLVVSLGFAGFWFVVSYIRYHKWQGSLAGFAVMFLMMFTLLMAVFAISSILYKRRSCEMERLADQDEQEN